eukprot:s1_g1472.t1
MAVAVTALAVLIVPMAMVAVVIRVTLGSPILFRQERIGLAGRSFHIVKFRTMRDAVDADGVSLPDDQRMTVLGRFLRSTSIDELPELWNIVRGDMSFVGPRPLLPEYLPYYLPDQMRRHEVRPGLTGLAQINGRNSQSWDERFQLDVEYVDSQSLSGDIVILLKTFLSVVSREGVSAEGHETMPRFDDQVWVLGGGGHAKVVIATLQTRGDSVAGVFDDDASKKGEFLLSTIIQGVTPELAWWESEARSAIIAIGDNLTRQRVAEIPAHWVTAVHDAANVHASVKVGRGTLVCAGVIIQPDVEIGSHAIVNTGASIDHDCKIGDFAHVAPGATLAGEVSIGNRALIGAGATVIQGVEIGADAVVGAGAVVVSNVSDGDTVAGVPARSLTHD